MPNDERLHNRLLNRSDIRQAKTSKSTNAALNGMKEFAIGRSNSCVTIGPNRVQKKLLIIK